MQNPPVYVIFQGNWNQNDETTALTSVQHILGGPYLSGLVQYGSDGKATLVRSFPDGGKLSLNPSVDALQQFLHDSITYNKAFPDLTNYDPRHAPIYVVLTDPGSAANATDPSGWNAPGTYSFSDALVPVPIHMIWVSTSTPQTSGFNKDYFTSTLSHELVETISGITVQRPPGLPPGVTGVTQIGDGEAGGHNYEYRLGGPNGELVQAYWSDADKAFVVPGSTQQKLTLSPIWDYSGNFTGQYDLQANSNQIVIDPTGVITVSVSVNGPVAQFDPDTIRNIYLATTGDILVVQKAAAQPFHVGVLSNGIVVGPSFTFSDGTAVYLPF